MSSDSGLSARRCLATIAFSRSLLQGGTPDNLDKDVEAFLVEGGVRTVFCGHKPCGDSPFVVRGAHVAVVHCDTTYSDGAAPDKRGSAVAAVEVSAPTSGQLQLRGVLADGRSYDFALYGEGGDDFVGRQCSDGSWVKAKLPEGCRWAAVGIHELVFHFFQSHLEVDSHDMCSLRICFQGTTLETETGRDTQLSLS